MLDLSTICHECGAYVARPSNARWPLCQRCEHDPKRIKRRERRREARRCQLARERAWRRGVRGKFYPEDIDRLRRRQGNRCAYCGADLANTGAHAEHKTPISRGGLNVAENLVLSCPACNQAKGTMTRDEFLRR